MWVSRTGNPPPDSPVRRVVTGSGEQIFPPVTGHSSPHAPVSQAALFLRCTRRTPNTIVNENVLSWLTIHFRAFCIESIHSQYPERPLRAQQRGSTVFAAVAGEPASLRNGDRDCVETSRSLHVLSARLVSCVTTPEASVTSVVVTAEAALTPLRRAFAPASARAISK